MSNKTSVKSQIAILEKRLAKGDLPAREFAEVTRTLAQLTGAIETYKRKPQPTTSGLGLPQSCHSGIWFVQIIESMAGIPDAPNMNELISRLTLSERREFEREAKRINTLSPEELEAWEDEQIREHPLWTPSPRTIFNGKEPTTEEEFAQIEKAGFHDLARFWRWHQQQPKADEAERAKLIASLSAKAETLPAEATAEPKPTTENKPITYSAEHMQEFYEFYKSL